MADKSRLFFTENFTANLDEIQSFLSVEGRSAFQRLLSRLFDDIGPQLSRFPLSGRSFFGHHAGAVEAQALVRRLQEKLRAGDDYASLWLMTMSRFILLEELAFIS